MGRGYAAERCSYPQEAELHVIVASVLILQPYRQAHPQIVLL